MAGMLGKEYVATADIYKKLDRYELLMHIPVADVLCIVISCALRNMCTS